MKGKQIIIILTGILLAFLIRPVFAQTDRKPATVQNPVTNESHRTVIVPEVAGEEAPAIVPLGSALDNGRVVEGYAIIHYEPGYAKPPWAGGGKGKGESKCYDFLMRGARWKATEDYVLDEANNDGLETNFVNSVIVASLETWDSQVAFEIFGPEDTLSLVDGADTQSPDGKNELFFGNISQEGAIAVAIVWGTFYGPPSAREIVEYDIVFDDPDYTWGDTTLNSSLMDLANIATHEIGHGAGLADLYETACSEQTMYGYADYGETKKRTLEAGDIAGTRELYR